MNRPTMVMTAGDPWSITTGAWAGLVFGPEAPFGHLVRMAASGEIRLVVCGSGTLISRQFARLGVRLPAAVELIDDGVEVANGLRNDVSNGLYPGDPAVRGAHAVAALEAAVHLSSGARPGTFAVVTGPIDKKACSLAGFQYPGQTEFFESAWSRGPSSGGSALMLLAGPRLRVGLATRHLPLKDVPAAITPDLVANQAVILARSLRDTFRIERPRVAVCGLNPHAGDRGLFGDEEALAIKPGIDAARSHPDSGGFEITGPHSGDTVFYEAWNGRYDGVLAMYHDQGLAPLKALHFHEAVNISAGLPHLRVSPDHGPASGLFLTGKADNGSFEAAIRVACGHLKLPLRDFT